MKKSMITLKIDAAKLKALEYYLPQNGTNVEKELMNHIDEIYNLKVPKEVKEFLKFDSGAQDMEQKGNENKTKTTAQKEKTVKEVAMNKQSI